MEIEIELEDRHKEAYQHMMACKAACKEMITNVAMHWEENFLTETEFWLEVRKYYKLSDDVTSWGIDNETYKIISTTVATPYDSKFFRVRNYMKSLFK